MERTLRFVDYLVWAGLKYDAYLTLKYYEVEIVITVI
jgi:hypothetical protein